MATKDHPNQQFRQGAPNGEAQPEWATGLKKLYNSVVDEPLPDSFKDLLSKLDKND